MTVTGTKSKHKHKATLYWAERAMVPLLGYEPMAVVDGFGYAHGSVVCAGNFDNVEAKRREYYRAISMEHPRRLPIWC